MKLPPTAIFSKAIPSSTTPSAVPTPSTKTSAASAASAPSGTTSTSTDTAPPPSTRALQHFEGQGSDQVPHHQKSSPLGAVNLFALQVAQKSKPKAVSTSTTTTSSKPWDPVATLPPALQARLSAGDKVKIAEAVGAIQQAVEARGLDHIPVFGYLSLRTNNFAELGKASQDDVVVGKDVVDATLLNHDIDVVASSIFRGTPEHPGAVAGITEVSGKDTPGVILKLDVKRADELLGVLLARELFAEGDLTDRVGDDGRPISNAMYAPAVRDVILDPSKPGETVPAFLFVTNTDGAKAVTQPGAFGDDLGLTVERMAWLFAGTGGFVDDAGAQKGGKSLDYWEHSYVKAREVAGQPVDPKIKAAVDLAKLMPQAHVVDDLLARTDPEARLMVDALAVLFKGAVNPLAIRSAQKPDQGLVRRAPQSTPAEDKDAVARLLAEAKKMAAAGILHSSAS